MHPDNRAAKFSRIGSAGRAKRGHEAVASPRASERERAYTFLALRERTRAPDMKLSGEKARAERDGKSPSLPQDTAAVPATAKQKLTQNAR